MIWAAVTGILIFTTVAYFVGFRLGRADMVNRLIDTPNSEGWNWAHYLRADLKAEKIPKP